MMDSLVRSRNMNSMSSVGWNDVYRWNNEAVTLRQQGNAVAATLKLEMALHHLNSLVIGTDHPWVRDAWSCCCGSCRRVADDRSAPPVVFRSVALECENASVHTGSNMFVFYLRAFRLENPFTHEYRREYFLVILYNLALFYHEDALRNSQSLDKALECYEMILSYLCQCGSGDDHLLLLLLAIANNMGHAYSHQGNLPKMSQSYQWLQTLTLVASREPKEEGEGEYIFFLQTAALYAAFQPVGVTLCAIAPAA